MVVVFPGAGIVNADVVASPPVKIEVVGVGLGSDHVNPGSENVLALGSAVLVFVPGAGIENVEVDLG